MRILALTNLYPNPWQPSRAPFNRQLFRALAAQHSVAVIAPIAWTDELAARWRGCDGLPTHRRVLCDGIVADHPRYLFPPKVLRRWYGHCFRHSVRTSFNRAVNELRPEIVYASWAYPDGWAAVDLGHQAGLPVVIRVHGSDIYLLDVHSDRKGPTREALCRAEGVIAPSKDLARRVVELGADPARVHVIYNGVDAGLFYPGERSKARRRLGLAVDEPIMLFIGNLVPVKGIVTLIEVAARLALDKVRFTCCVIGEGTLKPRLLREIRKRGLTGHVNLLGSRPHDQLPDWYRAADVLALPSHSEGVPNVLLEASACGTRFVACDVGGVSEVVHLGEGRLVPPGDVVRFAEAVRDALTDSVPCPAASPNPPWSFEDSASELAGILEQIVQTYGRVDQRASDPDPLRGRDILCFSHDWNGDPLSKTHLMRLLARDNRILWVNSIGYRTPTVSKADVSRVFKKLAAAAQPLREVERNIHVLNPLALPLYGPVARGLNRLLLRYQITRAMRRLRFRRPMSWVFNPAAAVVAGTLGEECVIYYCVDEYTAFTGVARESLADLEQQLLRKSDLVIVSAQKLYESKAGANPNTFLVRHGVDHGHFRKALDAATRVPEEIARLPRPVIGFFGLIADWVDVELMAHVAKQFPSGSLVVLGKVVTDVSLLKRLPNVHLLGQRSYADLPAFCRGFDVALNPFRINTLTLNANPLKVREYLSAGLPVVSTAIPEVEALGACRIGRHPDEFIQEINAALADPGPTIRRSETMRHESWETRLDTIAGHLVDLRLIRSHDTNHS